MQVSLAMNFLYMRQHSFWYCKGWIILIMLNAGAFQQVMDHIVVLIELIRMLPCGMRVPQQLFCSCVNNVLNGFWVNSRSSSALPSSEFQVIKMYSASWKIFQRGNIDSRLGLAALRTPVWFDGDSF